MSTTKTLVVTNFKDNGSRSNPVKGSLRDAIKQGHQLALQGHHINIIFQTEKASETIQLKDELYFKWGTWSINEGEGAKNVTLDGGKSQANAVSAIFYKYKAPSHPLNVKVNSLNVINFKADDATSDPFFYDGKVRLSGANIEWRNSVFQNNVSSAGVIHSVHSSTASKIKLENVHFLGNEATSRNGELIYVDKQQGNTIEITNSYYSKVAATPYYKQVRLQPGNTPENLINAQFERGAAAPELSPARVIESSSIITDSTRLNLKGDIFKLDANKGYALYQKIENGETNMVTPSASNDQQLLSAIRKHASYTYRTKSEQEIRDSRTSFFGSELSKMMGTTALQKGASLYAGTEGGKALLAKADPIINKATAMWASSAGKATLIGGGIAGAAAAIGIGALFHHSNETARIENELAKKKAIDAEHDDFKASLPTKLEFNPINTLQERTVSVYDNFNFTHQDSFYFLPAGMGAQISYISQTDNRDIVSFSYNPYSLKKHAKGTNSAKEFSRWVLSSELTSLMRNEAGKDPSGYIATLKKVNSQGEVFLSNTGRWQVQKTTSAGYYAGPAWDRIKLQRQSSFEVTTRTETHSGNDIVIGDRGSNTILLGAGNDTASPGVGDDHIDGGTGIDTVSYLGLNQPIRLTAGHVSKSGESYMQVSNQQALTAERSINSRLLNVETIDAEGGSHLDLSGAAQAMRSDNSKDAAPYQLRTGIGSTVIGSDFHDGVTIDAARASRYNTDTSRFSHTTTINGGKGVDSLLIRNLGEHQQPGLEFRYDALTGRITSSEASGQGQRTWFQVQNVESIGIQGASLREDGGIVFDQKTNAITTFDPPTPRGDEAARDSDDDTDELTGSSSAGFSEGASTSPVPMRRLRMADHMPMTSVTEASETHVDVAMQAMPASTSSMNHTAWNQETQEQPIWAQKEFFIDPLA